GLPRAGAVLELDGDTARSLAATVATDIAIDVPGARWSYPRTIAHARSGTSVVVYAKLAPASAFEVVVGGTRRTLRPVTGTAALIEHAVAGAEIARLEVELAMSKGDAAKALRATIVKTSLETRVLSSE